MSKKSKIRRRKANPTEAALRGAAGRERARHFAEGGSPVTWNGGRMWTAQNKRAKSSREACRGKWS